MASSPNIEERHPDAGAFARQSCAQKMPSWTRGHRPGLPTLQRRAAGNPLFVGTANDIAGPLSPPTTQGPLSSSGAEPAHNVCRTCRATRHQQNLQPNIGPADSAPRSTGGNRSLYTQPKVLFLERPWHLVWKRVKYGQAISSCNPPRLSIHNPSIRAKNKPTIRPAIVKMAFFG